jgi:hypothetical protein
MEIEAPPEAVAIWLAGDQWLVRIPDGQLLEIPAGASQRLQTVLVARVRHARRPQDKLLHQAFPTQEILDAWREKNDAAFVAETWEERVRNAGARQRAAEEKRHEKVARKRQRLAEAETLLKEINL